MSCYSYINIYFPEIVSLFLVVYIYVLLKKFPSILYNCASVQNTNTDFVNMMSSKILKKFVAKANNSPVGQLRNVVANGKNLLLYLGIMKMQGPDMLSKKKKEKIYMAA
jgi:hypothetical protein